MASTRALITCLLVCTASAAPKPDLLQGGHQHSHSAGQTGPSQLYQAPNQEPQQPSGLYSPPQAPQPSLPEPQQPSGLYSPPQAPQPSLPEPQQPSGLYSPPQAPEPSLPEPQQPSGLYSPPQAPEPSLPEPQQPSGFYSAPQAPEPNLPEPQQLSGLYSPPQEGEAVSVVQAKPASVVSLSSTFGEQQSSVQEEQEVEEEIEEGEIEEEEQVAEISENAAVSGIYTAPLANFNANSNPTPVGFAVSNEGAVELSAEVGDSALQENLLGELSSLPQAAPSQLYSAPQVVDNEDQITNICPNGETLTESGICSGSRKTNARYYLFDVPKPAPVQLPDIPEKKGEVQYNVVLLRLPNQEPVIRYIKTPQDEQRTLIYLVHNKAEEPVIPELPEDEKKPGVAPQVIYVDASAEAQTSDSAEAQVQSGGYDASGNHVDSESQSQDFDLRISGVKSGQSNSVSSKGYQ